MYYPNEVLDSVGVGQVINILESIVFSCISNLVPGNTVLEERGFDISYSLDYYCSTLNTPVYTMDHSQLSAFELEQTRRKANVCIHV